jgi:predicted phage tail protein
MPGWFIYLLISLALQVVSFLLTPRAKTNKPDTVQDLESPTAESGRPVPVIFGTIPVDSPNILWYGEKSTKEEKA